MEFGFYSKHNGTQLEDGNQDGGVTWITCFEGHFGCCEETALVKHNGNADRSKRRLLSPGGRTYTNRAGSLSYV